MAYRRKSSRRSTARRSTRRTYSKARVSRRRTRSYSARRGSVRKRVGGRDVRIIVQQAQPQIGPEQLAFMRPAAAPRKRSF